MYAVASFLVIAVAVMAMVRRPRHPVSLVLAVMALGHLGGFVLDRIGPSGDLPNRVGGAFWVLTLPVVAVLVVVFPSGLRGRLGRALLGYQMFAIGWAVVAILAVGENSPSASAFFLAAAIPLVGVLVTGIIGVVQLWRHFLGSAGEERVRIGLFVAVAGLIAFLYPVAGLGTLAGGTFGEGLIDDVAGTLVVAGLPLAVAVSWLTGDVNRWVSIIRPVLDWTVRLAAASVVALVSVELLGLVGLTDLGTPAVVLVVAMVVVALANLMRRLGEGASRAVLGWDEMSGRTLRALASRLSEAVAPEDVPELVAVSLGASLGLGGVLVEEADGEGFRRLASWGDLDPATSSSHTLIHLGKPVGRLVVNGPGPADGAAFGELLPHVAAALEAGRLGRDLAEAHRRLLSARQSERTRIQSDLHDELNPTLSGIRISAATARKRLKSAKTADTIVQLETIETAARDALELVRRIIDDLTPLPLETAPLVGTLSHKVKIFDDPPEFSVHLVVDEPFPPLGLAQEAIIYRVCMEAIANAAKHSGGTWCELRLRAEAGSIVVEVVDDGTGLPADPTLGIGSRSMRERIERAGGTFEIRPNRPKGTAVTARLPMTL
jgi:two-component system, NarL family, sensor kinase